MRDKRRIIIKNPLFQKIRNNFRTIIGRAYYNKWKTINVEMERLSRDGNGKPLALKSMTLDLVKKYRSLQEEESILTDAIDRSICSCYACGKSDRDMVYNKPYDAWYCVECYDGTKKFYENVKQERLDKGVAKADHDDFDEEYHESFANGTLKEKHIKNYEKKEFWI